MRYVSVNSATDEWRELVPGGLGGELPEDTDWLTFETVKFRINPALSAEQREALRMDYGLAGGDLGTPRASVDETLSASRDVHRSRKPSGSAAALCVNGVKREPRAGLGVSPAGSPKRKLALQNVGESC